MSHQKSFVKQEHQIAPELRKQINAAESTEDVKKFFSRAAQRLLKDVAGDEFNCEPEELQLMPQFQPHFELSPGAQETLKELWSSFGPASHIGTLRGIGCSPIHPPGKAQRQD